MSDRAAKLEPSGADGHGTAIRGEPSGALGDGTAIRGER